MAPPMLILALDTATRSSVVALGDDALLASSRREVRHRHGSHVLEQIDAVLAEAGRRLDEVTALAVGTGPGSFTGLRVGMATAKTIAYARKLPLVGLMSTDVLRRAGVAAGAAPDAAVVLPAGAHDHYLAHAGADPTLVPPGADVGATGGGALLAVDVDPATTGEEAARLGAAALEGMPAALLALARERLTAGSVDDVATLTPAYVALPRGVRRAAEELGWSPDLR